MSEPICIQTGITCGFPCWHKCPRYDEVKGKNFNQPNQCEQAPVSGQVCDHDWVYAEKEQQMVEAAGKGKKVDPAPKNDKNLMPGEDLKDQRKLEKKSNKNKKKKED